MQESTTISRTEKNKQETKHLNRTPQPLVWDLGIIEVVAATSTFSLLMIVKKFARGCRPELVCR